jgi:hypothetical protein
MTLEFCFLQENESESHYCTIPIPLWLFTLTAWPLQPSETGPGLEIIATILET